MIWPWREWSGLYLGKGVFWNFNKVVFAWVKGPCLYGLVFTRRMWHTVAWSSLWYPNEVGLTCAQHVFFLVCIKWSMNHEQSGLAWIARYFLAWFGLRLSIVSCTCIEWSSKLEKGGLWFEQGVYVLVLACSGLHLSTVVFSCTQWSLLAWSGLHFNKVVLAWVKWPGREITLHAVYRGRFTFFPNNLYQVSR